MAKKSPFYHEISTEKKPWNHLQFGSREGEDFSFAIVGDRSGRPREGVFEDALKKIDLMRPDFTISVGDLINGYNNEHSSRSFLLAQWKEILPAINQSKVPYFYIPGNHDFVTADEKVHKTTAKLWKEFFGVEYYFFIYKDVLFLCLNTNGVLGKAYDIGEEQRKWAVEILRRYKDVRWTFVFMHAPGGWHEEEFHILEEELYERNYTVFAGDLHTYRKFTRNGRKYIMMGLTGGGAEPGKELKGVHFGEFDHITWVSFADGEPRILNLALEGMYYEDVVTTDKLTWLTPKYFRADKPITKAEKKRLKAKGLIVE